MTVDVSTCNSNTTIGARLAILNDRMEVIRWGGGAVGCQLLMALLTGWGVHRRAWRRQDCTAQHLIPSSHPHTSTGGSPKVHACIPSMTAKLEGGQTYFFMVTTAVNQVSNTLGMTISLHDADSHHQCGLWEVGASLFPPNALPTNVCFPAARHDQGATPGCLHHHKGLKAGMQALPLCSPHPHNCQRTLPLTAFKYSHKLLFKEIYIL